MIKLDVDQGPVKLIFLYNANSIVNLNSLWTALLENNLAISTKNHKNLYALWPNNSTYWNLSLKNVQKAVYSNIFTAHLLKIGKLGGKCTSVDKWLSKS